FLDTGLIKKSNRYQIYQRKEGGRDYESEGPYKSLQRLRDLRSILPQTGFGNQRDRKSRGGRRG
ncbi:hypothetical protein PN584_17725, partial [Parabacteroides merdae]